MSARARLWDAAANNALRLDKTIISRMSEACVRCDGTSPTQSGSCAIQWCFARAWHPASDRTGNCRARHAKPLSSIAEVAGWSLSVSLLSTSLPRCPRNHACLPACLPVRVRTVCAVTNTLGRNHEQDE
jgi:hypothetical protein